MAGSERFEAALGRWMEAVRGRGDGALTAAAVTEDCVVERYHPLHGEASPAEVISGVEAVNRWLSLTPEVIRWEVDAVDEVDAAGGAGRVRYRLSSEGFVNHGWWRIRLSEGALIVYIEHRPDALPEGV